MVYTPNFDSSHTGHSESQNENKVLGTAIHSVTLHLTQVFNSRGLRRPSVDNHMHGHNESSLRSPNGAAQEAAGMLLTREDDRRISFYSPRAIHTDIKKRSAAHAAAPNQMGETAADAASQKRKWHSGIGSGPPAPTLTTIERKQGQENRSRPSSHPPTQETPFGIQKPFYRHPDSGIWKCDPIGCRLLGFPAHPSCGIRGRTLEPRP